MGDVVNDLAELALLEDAMRERVMAAFFRTRPPSIKLTASQAALVNCSEHRNPDGSYQLMVDIRPPMRVFLMGRPVDWVDTEAESILGDGRG